MEKTKHKNKLATTTTPQKQHKTNTKNNHTPKKNKQNKM